MIVVLDTTQDFLWVLDIKPRMQLVEIILVGLIQRMTIIEWKIMSSTRCICGLMPNSHKNLQLYLTSMYGT